MVEGGARRGQRRKPPPTAVTARPRRSRPTERLDRRAARQAASSAAGRPRREGRRGVPRGRRRARATSTGSSPTSRPAGGGVGPDARASPAAPGTPSTPVRASTASRGVGRPARRGRSVLGREVAAPAAPSPTPPAAEASAPRRARLFGGRIGVRHRRVRCSPTPSAVVRRRRRPRRRARGARGAGGVRRGRPTAALDRVEDELFRFGRAVDDLPTRDGAHRRRCRRSAGTFVRDLVSSAADHDRKAARGTPRRTCAVAVPASAVEEPSRSPASSASAARREVRSAIELTPRAEHLTCAAPRCGCRGAHPAQRPSSTRGRRRHRRPGGRRRHRRQRRQQERRRLRAASAGVPATAARPHAEQGAEPRPA